MAGSDCECVRMLRRTGRFRLVLTAWLEEQITAMVELPPICNSSWRA